MNDLETLAREYRKIKASPYLATRIEAHVKASHSTTRWKSFGWWWPVLGAGTLAAVIGLMLATRVVEAPPSSIPERVVAHHVPGFSQLAGSPVTTASITSPSFANLRSVNSPALPDRPEKPVKPLL